MSRLDPSGIKSWTPCGARHHGGVSVVRRRRAAVHRVSRWPLPGASTRSRAQSCATRRSASCRRSPRRPTVPRSSSAERRVPDRSLARLDRGHRAGPRRAVLPRGIRWPLHPVRSRRAWWRGLIESELVLATPGSTGCDCAAGGRPTLNVVAPLPVPTPVSGAPGHRRRRSRGLRQRTGRRFDAVVVLDGRRGSISNRARSWPRPPGRRGCPSPPWPVFRAPSRRSPRRSPGSTVDAVVAACRRRPRRPPATGWRSVRAPATPTSGRIRLGPGETFTAAGVPPGRYFVRLHAREPHRRGPGRRPKLVVDVP